MMPPQQKLLDYTRSDAPTTECSKLASDCLAVMEERSRLACEIHDGLAQAFAGILLQLEGVVEWAGPRGNLRSNSVKRVARARHLAKCGLEESRRMLLGLRPKSLEGGNLIEALKALARHYANNSRIVCKFRFIGQETDLSPGVQDEFYRIAQEALCNVRKHSRATSASILLNCESYMIALTIRDNGQGFAPKRPEAAREGFGLTSMRERALRIGGRMDIDSAPGGGGTEVRVRVLLPAISPKG